MRERWDGATWQPVHPPPDPPGIEGELQVLGILDHWYDVDWLARIRTADDAFRRARGLDPHPFTSWTDMARHPSGDPAGA